MTGTTQPPPASRRPTDRSPLISSGWPGNYPTGRHGDAGSDHPRLGRELRNRAVRRRQKSRLCRGAADAYPPYWATSTALMALFEVGCGVHFVTVTEQRPVRHRLRRSVPAYGPALREGAWKCGPGPLGSKVRRGNGPYGSPPLPMYWWRPVLAQRPAERLPGGQHNRPARPGGRLFGPGRCPGRADHRVPGRRTVKWRGPGGSHEAPRHGRRRSCGSRSRLCRRPE